MALLERVVNRPGLFLVECPGCQSLHHIPTKDYDGSGPRWEWNGDMEKPTFSPSLHVNPSKAPNVHVCHSFIRNGYWEFLNDCTHELAGKKVPMIDVD